MALSSYTGRLTVSGPITYSANGNTTSFSCENNQYCHFRTNTATGFWFEKSLAVKGEIHAGLNYDQRVWHAGNGGTGSGLDADLLDGYHANQFFNPGSNGADISGQGFPFQAFGDANSAAGITFHRHGVYAVNLGLSKNNILCVGGWSMGPVQYQIWHAGNGGTGSGLDADLLDGYHASEFAKSGNGVFSNSISLGRHSSSSIGQNSIAVGRGLYATGVCSSAFGSETSANGHYSASFGFITQTNTDCQLVIGKYNRIENGLFIIGHGSGSGSKSNIFRVDTNGNVYASGPYNTGGADYAELFEWEDNNVNNEDRRGLFVKLNKTKISIANSPDDFIIGIVSGNPAIIGNNYDNYKDQYLKDMWDNIIYTDQVVPCHKIIEKYTETDENGKEIEKEREVIIREEHIESLPTPNPIYDNTLMYVPRHERKEWSPVGMLGQLVIRDNGLCEVGSFCKCGLNGIAVSSTRGYYIMERINENFIKVLFK